MKKSVKGPSQRDTAEEIARQQIEAADPRRIVATPYGQARREHTPTSDTDAIARQVLDAMQAFQRDGLVNDDSNNLSDLMNEIGPEAYQEIIARAFAAAAAQRAGRKR